MSTLEVNTIDSVSGTSNLTIGGSNNTGSTTIKTNNTNAVEIDNSQNLKFNSGYGSVVTAFGVRAWVNFNGKNTVAIRDSGNVSSITDNGTGDYTVNFSTAMPDANYCIKTSSGEDTAGSNANHMGAQLHRSTPTTSACRINTINTSGSAVDHQFINVGIVR